MSQISTWYNNHSGAFRSTSRLRAPSLVPSNRVAVNQQTLVVDGRNNNARTGTNGNNAATGTGDAAGKEGQGKRRETIFGPDVGEDDEPGWTMAEDGVKVGVETVRGWVERAKAEEGLHATTTLQALVNLKRPTLQLLQLDSAPDPRVAIRRDLASIPAGTVLSPSGAAQPATRSMSNNLGVDDINPALRSMSMSSAFSTGSGMSIPSAPLHLIKFFYDATSPAVRITLTIHPRLSTAPPVEGKESIHEEEQAESVRTVYTGIHAGGFNQNFQLPHSAAMDLSSAVAPMPAAGADEEDDKKNLPATPGVDTGTGTRGARSEDTTRSSYERGMSNMSTTLATVPEMEGHNGGAGGDDVNNNAGVGGRVRNLFGRRRRENDVEQGNIEMEERNAEGNKEEGEEKEEKGMRVLIRIEGVGAEGEPLSRRNAQLTHILINGMWVADNTASTSAVDDQAPVPAATGKRVWVVKVVRREAIIGAHTFLLKEIYGLSTAASTTTSTSYPPSADAADPYASTPNECIVCLTSPRDVVLLPCRHLVVCRECAVGMVEFGAGGKVARREEGTEDTNVDTAVTEGAGGAAAGAATAAGAAAPAVAGGTTTGGRERRKKKAKGWYCPVCRQPYTSLLRLALPEVGGADADAEGGADIDAHSTHSHVHAHGGEGYNDLSLTRTRSRGAASVKSRKSLYLHKVGSRATLPDGAEKMLEALRPDADRAADEMDSDEEVEDNVLGTHAYGNSNDHGQGTGGSSRYVVPEADRPQFVLGDEVDLDAPADKKSNGGTDGEVDKAEVEHREVADWKQSQHAQQDQHGQAQDETRGEGEGRKSTESKKGWKEV